METNSLRSSKH